MVLSNWIITPIKVVCKSLKYSLLTNILTTYYHFQGHPSMVEGASFGLHSGKLRVNFAHAEDSSQPRLLHV